jgi:hypothetical protein
MMASPSSLTMTEPSPPEPPAALADALAQLAAGNHRAALSAARALTTDADPAVAAAARAVVARLEPDPAALAATAIALGVLALVATAYLF